MDNGCVDYLRRHCGSSFRNDEVKTCSDRRKFSCYETILSHLLVFFLCALMFTHSHAQGTRVKTYTLHYKTAEQVIPLIKPMLVPGAVISGQGKLLMIKSTYENLTEVRYMLRNIDLPTKQLRILVKTDRHHGLETSSIAANDIREYETNSLRNEHVQQSIQVSEGSKAYIATGEEIPVISTAPFNVWGSIGIEYKPIESGFVVTPMLLPNNKVQLNIQQYKEKLDYAGDTDIQYQKSGTIAVVPVNHWFNLGGSQMINDAPEEDFVYQTTNHFRNIQRLYVKVQVVQ